MKLIKRKVIHFKFLVPLVFLQVNLKFTPQTDLQYVLIDMSYLVLKSLICKSVVSLPSCEG